MTDREALEKDPGAEVSSGPAELSEAMEYGDRTRNLRMMVLLTTLGLLLFAVWYDYKVARPSVDQAFDSVGHLNRKINSSAAIPAMTNNDVRQAIGFTPSYTITKGNYQVEVYAWTAGLPFRSHDYYAVYTGTGNNLKFMRHYKFFLPVDDLTPKSSVPHLASARRAARNPGPNPREAVGDQWDAEAQDARENQQRREAAEQGAMQAQTAATDP